jgi:hypothetical protein
MSREMMFFIGTGFSVGVKEASATCTSIYTRAVRSKQEVGQPSENACAPWHPVHARSHVVRVFEACMPVSWARGLLSASSVVVNTPGSPLSSRRRPCTWRTEAPYREACDSPRSRTA